MIHPNLRDLFVELSRHTAFQELLRRLEALRVGGQAETVPLGGLTDTAKALYLVLLWQAAGKPLLVVAGDSHQAESLAELVRAFFDLLVADTGAPRPVLVPAPDALPYQNLSPHPEICEERAVALWRLAEGRASIAVAPAAAALFRNESAEHYRGLALELAIGEEIPLELLVDHLERTGYRRRDPVEMVGEYSVRGGILDVFPPEAEYPVRIELVGDTIESLRRFEVATQRSIFRIEQCLLLPLAEWPRERRLLAELAERAGLAHPPPPGEAFPGWEFWVPLVRPRTSSLAALDPTALLVISEPESVRQAADRLWARLREAPRGAGLAPEANFLTWEQWSQETSGRLRVELRELGLGASGEALRIASRPALAFRGNVPAAVAETRSLVESGYRAVFFAPSAGEVERLADIFYEYAVPFQIGREAAEGTPPYLRERAYVAGAVSSVYLVRALVRRGTLLPEPRVALIGSEDLFESSALVARPGARRRAGAAFAADIGDLKPGDYVVHATHGVGRFLGLRELSKDGYSGDFMLLEYADQARLYVPLTRLDLVQKYRGTGDVTPKLDRLGGATWSRTKARVKAKVRDMAEELLRLYAERQLAQGHAFSPDSDWQREFDEAFEYTETADQLTAIEEIKRDMERPQPMDRLLCGDVGYGKTEVAMRAAFKALGDGKQVAVLAPTTVLCLQHYETFRNRFAPFPVRIEMLSRFRSLREIDAVLKDLAAGKVDIVIGTHRLLSKDVEFADLGLLIIDEEQRFGVRHKERLKQLRKNVDVLTMTATPIPRTLHMALLGLRDLSVIETPPKDRLAIQTVVTHFDPAIVKAAIELELARGGQIYYIHNRVETIWERAALIQQLVPQCRIAVGHGQMAEAALEKVLLGFMRGAYDVFVSTTIVENGLDIPLANTILIENAHLYGLAELYQLRGRVGRSNRRAYAYLLVPPEAELSEVARKRLAALKEFSDLGSGFKVAALDLELRGGGNLLGAEQHGHINLVGFDTYLRLLEQTVQELKGEEAPPEIHSRLNLGLDIRIPPEYIADEHQRLRAYKQIAEARDRGETQRVLGELEDRYGKAPEAVHNLLQFTLLKSLAERLGIEAIERRAGAVHIKFHPESRVQPERLMRLVREIRGSQFTPAGVLRLPLDGEPKAPELLTKLEQHLSRLA